MKLEEWRRQQGLTYRALAEIVGIGVETARQHCQDPGHPAAMVPRPRVMERYVELTGGAVQPADFYRTDREKAA